VQRVLADVLGNTATTARAIDLALDVGKFSHELTAVS